MKHNYKILVKLLVILALTVGMASPVQAYSRSASVKISCTILPMLEMSLPSTMAAYTAFASSQAVQAPKTELALVSDGALVQVNTNLGHEYQMTESLVKGESGNIHLYSITVL